MSAQLVNRHRPLRTAAALRFRLALAGLLGVSLLAGLARSAAALDPGGEKRLVPVPTSGIGVDLWSDPAAGSLVSPGSRASFYARTNADCYLALLSVDTEGRMRLLYPRPFDDGWVEGGRTYRVPDGSAGYDLRFTGPPGMEYVFAVASFYPIRPHYPAWMLGGLEPPPYAGERDEACDPYRTGWVVGDPYYRMREFCEQLVPYPERRESYATAWVNFNLGRRVPYPRFLCSDCHGGGWVDPYGPACPAVRVRVGDVACSGWLDFRIDWHPRYSYECWSGWRPRSWTGGRWDGPDGRWVWSSADDHRRFRDHFRDAAPHGREVRGGPGDRREDRREDWRENQRDGRPDPRGNDSRERPEDPNGWGRGFEERLQRVLGSEDRDRAKPEERREKPRGPEVRNGKPAPGVPAPNPPARPDRDDRSREPKGPKDSSPRKPDQPKDDGHRSPERPSRGEHGRSR